MKFRSMGMAALAVALLAPASAHAEVVKGWYTGLNTNMSFQSEGDAKVNGVKDKIEYKTGWGVGGYGGYGFGNGLRTEGELVYRHSSVKKVTGLNAGPDNGGGIHNTALMINGLYDIQTGTRLTPYVGLGVGGAYVNADDMRTINGATMDDDNIAFAYQGIAGAALSLSGGWAVTADYRYFATPDVKFKTDLPGIKGKTENASHNLMLGIRYTFAQPEKPAPAPQAAMTTPEAPAPVAAPKAQAPAVAPIPQSYMVFFDFDKATLTPEAQRIIASAADDFKKGKYIRLVVTGHTDTMGTAKYNQKLSERRAAAVKAEFEKLGVPAGEIMSAGVGKTGLLVPTNDQVREAQNRRAEIVLKQ